MEHISNILERCLVGRSAPPEAADPPPVEEAANLVFYNQPPDLPLHVFPPEIRQLIRQAAVSFKNAPIEVPLVGLLSLLSACVGRTRTIEVKGSWQESGNLYLVLAGDSGSGKSHCFKAMLKPVWNEDLSRKQQWDSELARYNADVDKHAKSKDKGEPSELPAKPVRRQYIIEDATIEAIGKISSENPRGPLWMADELAGLLGSLDRYSSGRNDSAVKARILSAYDSLPWKTSRRDSDKDQTSAAASLSITSTTQPEILKELFTRRDALSGLLSRFIFIQARRLSPPTLTDEVFIGQAMLEKIAAHLLAWEMDEVNGQMVPRKVKLAAEAFSLYEGWHNKLVTEAWHSGGMDSLIAPKLVTQVLRLALLLHCLKAALEGSDGLSDISLDTMRGAIALGDWMYVHQRQVWALLGFEKEEISEPLDKAIIQVSIELEGYLKDHDWKITNDEFNRRVADKYGQNIDSSQIGKAAARLGIKSVTIGKKRGKEYPRQLVKAFQAGDFLSTCRQRLKRRY